MRASKSGWNRTSTRIVGTLAVVAALPLLGCVGSTTANGASEAPMERPGGTLPPLPIDVGPGGGGNVEWKVDSSPASPGNPYQIRKDLKCDLDYLRVWRGASTTPVDATEIDFTLKRGGTQVKVRLNKSAGNNAFLLDSVALAACEPGGSGDDACVGHGLPEPLFGAKIGSISGTLAVGGTFSDGVRAQFKGTACN